MFSVCRRSSNNCRRPEGGRFLFDGASDHTEATNFFSGNGTKNLSAVATTSLIDTKTWNVFKKTALWTIVMLFSHSLGRFLPLVSPIFA